MENIILQMLNPLIYFYSFIAIIYFSLLYLHLYSIICFMFLRNSFFPPQSMVIDVFILLIYLNNQLLVLVKISATFYFFAFYLIDVYSL